MTLRAEVAYVGPEGQFLLAVEVPDGATAGDAIRASGIAARLPGVAIDDAHVGVWSKPCGLAAVLHDGDRVEIYRPLQADPKEIRRRRAEEQRRR